MNRPRPRVLVVTPWFPTAGDPSAGRFVADWVRAASRDHDVAVLLVRSVVLVAPRRGSASRTVDHVDLGIPVHSVVVASTEEGLTRTEIRTWIAGSTAGVSFARRFRPDVVHAHTYVAGSVAAVIAKVRSIPLVVTEHFSRLLAGALPLTDRIRAWMAYSAAAEVTAVSPALVQAVRRIVPRDVSVIPNPVDQQTFRPSPGRRHAKGNRRLITVGRLEPVKGIDLLLVACRSLLDVRQDWHLDIVGTGRLAVNYETLAIDLGLEEHVTFHGPLPRERIAQMFRDRDLCVVPSVIETFSVVAAEALMSGVPVLATRCGGPEHFISPDLGLVVPAESPSALSQGLCQILNELDDLDPEHISGVAGQRFGMSSVSDVLSDLYSGVLAHG